jgi:hypothetical protein
LSLFRFDFRFDFKSLILEVEFWDLSFRISNIGFLDLKFKPTQAEACATGVVLDSSHEDLFAVAVRYRDTFRAGTWHGHSGSEPRMRFSAGGSKQAHLDPFANF